MAMDSSISREPIPASRSAGMCAGKRMWARAAAMLPTSPGAAASRGAGPALVVVGVGALLGGAAAGDVGSMAAARAHIRFPAHIPADLEAGIGARDIEESIAIETADLHVFDRLGLDGKIGSLCPRDRNETGCGTEEKAFHHLHRNLQVR